MIQIQKDDLSDGAIERLLNTHIQEMYKHSPAESVHAIDPEKLKDPSVTFWSARINNELVGCGALKELYSSVGEIKSMKTDENHLRKGIGARLLSEIITEARKRSYGEISLETGSNEAFNPAITMYEMHGFVECPPFGEYKLDPYSKFYTKKLSVNL
ncbi:putative acetyltransferase [Sinobacterium caligoides]|uniref:Putative acetyltransferase n=1 Tax=Sinobacterium caligoides TaxID=933926 RepID=A0A3N2D556_9GAMM|nr:GNAT family N-acetyltransferase [Sinobacterium caligoides]ROR94899.1 putative acetyltransferase [Sinobacterium caligoides]